MEHIQNTPPSQETQETEKPKRKSAKKTKEERKTNPNGANQYLLDPRQKMCWDAYINPKSPTFGNAAQSAIAAGYEPEYANQITVSEWFIVKLRRLNLLGKAEKVLEEMVDMSDEVDVVVEGIPLNITKREPALTRIKQDTAKFLAERLGKNDGYASRNEVTGPDGQPLVVDPTEKAKSDALIDNLLNGKPTGGNQEHTGE